HILFQAAVYALLIYQIVERVIERAQIRINFFLKRSWQKPQPLASFYRRTRQDNAVYLLVIQGRDCHRYREISFAGASRTDAEHHVVSFNGVQVAALVDALGLYLPLAE